MTFAVCKRLVLIPFTLLVIISATWALMSLVPGDALVGERSLSGEALAEKIRQYEERHNWRLYLSNIIQGNLGTSYVEKEKPIWDIIGPSLPVSFGLGFLALCFAALLGLGCGLIAATFRSAWPDHSAMLLALLGLSLPAFVLGPLLQLQFALEWPWFELAGWWHPLRDPPDGSWRQLVLPSVTLGAIPAATIARITRSSLLEVLGQDYVRTALAKGLGPLKVVLGHGLRNAFLPVLSYLGPAAAAVLMGSVVVEQVFSIPGVGRYFVQGALNRDYELVLGVVILYSLLLLCFNLLVDILYTKIDPRVSFE